MKNREPLPRGTVIEYAEQQATVVEDIGGTALLVDCEGDRLLWYWTFEGETCRVIRPAVEAGAASGEGRS